MYMYIPDEYSYNTWNITRNIMILYHEVLMYFILGLGGGGSEIRGGEGAPK